MIHSLTGSSFSMVCDKHTEKGVKRLCKKLRNMGGGSVKCLHGVTWKEEGVEKWHKTRNAAYGQLHRYFLMDNHTL